MSWRTEFRKTEKRTLLHEQLVRVRNYTHAQEVATTPKPLHLQLVFCNWGWWEVPPAQLVPLFPTGPS